MPKPPRTVPIRRELLKLPPWLLGGAFLFASISLPALAQSPDDPPARAQPVTADAALATPTGNEVAFNLGHYNYTEPGQTAISIHGTKLGGGYTGTLSLGERRLWFARLDARGVTGSATYDGWCFPFVITPNAGSPNGYELGLGDASPCSESGDSDWYVETRGVLVRDLVGDRWGFSPYAGLGLRHLSNGTTGVKGFRTDDYLYVPLGVTARTKVTSHGTLALTVEYDRLIRGWQTTRDSQLGGGDVPATPTAPAFTINGFTDISFSQHAGWGVRASAKYQITRRWSVEPAYIHWNVGDSPVSYETVTFTVNNVSAREQWGAYEPQNATDEFTVKLGFRF